MLVPQWLWPDNGFRLHWGFVVAILATVFVWWLMERSTVGFQIRAVGANPAAARTAAAVAVRHFGCRGWPRSARASVVPSSSLP